MLRIKKHIRVAKTIRDNDDDVRFSFGSMSLRGRQMANAKGKNGEGVYHDSIFAEYKCYFAFSC